MCPPAGTGFTLSAGHHRARRLTFAQLAAALHLDRVTRRTAIEQLRMLHRAEGLPLPVNPRLWKGKLCRDESAICAASLWDAAAIEAWLHRPGPAAPSRTVPPPPINLRAEMKNRALRLAGAGA